jgi:hypothetical protein
MNSEKQQTAIEWLVEQFENHKATFFKLNDKEERVITLAGRDVVEQAKEIEKKQIINAVDEGISQGYGKYIDTEWGRENDWKAEQYYNETYGK